jgi:stage V sporulation protein D (sporulation-specific penicillin-binding protein)
MDQELFQKRIYLVSALVILAVIIFTGKLFYLQIIHGHSYEQLGDRQYVTNTSNLFDRGSIYFSDKDGNRVSAATLKSGFKIAVDTAKIGDPAKLYENIGGLLAVDKGSFIAQVSKKNDPYVEIAVNVGEETASKITAMKLKGVTVFRSNWRFYPADTLASQAIGFMAYKGDEYTGRYGIERFYNTTLARTDQRLYVNFFAEVFSDITKFVSNKDEIEGDVVTTIDPSIQQALDQAVTTIKEKWSSDRVGAMVMDPKTGAIYAMSLDNRFDLNQTKTVSDVSQFNDPLVESVFEMGSIMKPVVMAIALDQGAVTPTTTYTDKGSVKVGDRTIYNFDKKARGNATMQTVLNQSLNTGMVFVMQQMKKEAFKTQWESFGFGKKTGIDLPAEAVGLVSNLNTNRDVEFANVSFGQGVAVTPVEMIRAQSALANGGRLVTPHIVQSIEYPSGFSKKLDWPVTGQLIKHETAVTITKMLTTVFDNYNDGKTKMEHYTIAAKTGTAQIPNHEKGGYYTDRNLHTFMAYFPANNPKFIVFFFNQYPKNGAQFSSETLLPPFIDLAKFLINYYDLPPDR